MARKGAMKKDPPKREQKPSNRQASPPKQTTPSQQTQPVTSANRPPSKWTRTGPGTYKDQYGNVLKGQKVAPKKDMSQRGQKPPTPPPPVAPPPATEQPAPGEQPPPPTQPVTFADQPFPDQVDTVTDTSGNVINRMGEIAAGFDPATMQQNYEIGFAQERERYTKNLMDQFERRNQRQFEQQRLNTQQQIAERGLDPASPAAQELMRQQNEREDMARQEAMSSAEQASYGIAGQAFGQARELALTPGQINQQFQDPFMARMGFQQQTQMQQQEIAANAELARLEREAAAGRLDVQGQQALQQLKEQFRQRKWEVRNQPRGGGGGGGGGSAGPTLYERMQAGQLSTGYGQGEQPNPWAAVGQGIAAGAGGQITSNLNRR